MSSQGNLSSPQNFDGSRRMHSYSRQNDELHLSPNYAQMGQQNSSSYIPLQDAPRAAGHSQTANSAPATAHHSGSGRPSIASSSTAPSSVPLLPPISTQSQQYSTPSRGSTANNSHSYSRSSPAAGYVNTPETSGFPSPPAHKYMPSHTPQNTSYSPLGLADIRPRADSGLSDGQGHSHSQEAVSDVPTNCNYLAPWAVYAFDWCKWPVQHQGLGDAAGKMALGSYLEDGHNFVSDYVTMRYEAG
jgi:WD repeat-containing protein 68